MKFILTSGWDDGIADLTRRLSEELTAGNKVLWLVSGGSNIQASVTVMDNIATGLSNNLTVTLSDERFGPEGHADSNWAQLLNAGFDGKNATLKPVLNGEQSLEESANSYASIIHESLDQTDIVIAQWGIGTDGHITGILPLTDAATSSQAVCGYETEAFTRLTITFETMRKVNVAYAFAFGDPKKPTLIQLLNKKLPLAEQPAQILKELPEAYLYNDQVGEA